MIEVTVQSKPDPSITVIDNGPGIPTETVKALLDFSVRVSSCEAYPTRMAWTNEGNEPRRLGSFSPKHPENIRLALVLKNQMFHMVSPHASHNGTKISHMN